MKVLKVGGESTGTPEKIKNLTNYIKNIPETIILVVSAPATEKRITELLRNIFNGEDRKQEVDNIFQHLAQGLEIDFDINLWNCTENAKRIDDFLYIGEYANSKLITQYFQKQGINATWIDARKAILTDSNFGSGNILSVNKDLFKNHQVYVLGGFHGANENRETVILPPGGSDITAGAIAGFLEVNEYQNIKEFPGVAVVDPKFIENAIIMKHATYAEVREAVYRSRKALLEPTSLHWCKKENIPIRVKSLQSNGTLITEKRELTNQSPLTNIASKDGFVIYTIEGISFTKLFGVFDNNKVSIDMINTKDNTISVAVHKNELKNREKIEEELKKLGSLEIHEDQALISIVGEGISKPLTFRKWLKENLNGSPIAVYGPILGGLQTNLTIFYIELFEMNSIVGYTKKLADFFEKNNLKIISTSTCIDAFSVGISNKLTKEEILNICNKFKEEVGADTISVLENGIHCYGSEKDVRNITLALPSKDAKDTINKLYSILIENGYFQ